MLPVNIHKLLYAKKHLNFSWEMVVAYLVCIYTVFFICRDSVCWLAGYVELAREIRFWSERRGQWEESIEISTRGRRIRTCTWKASDS